MFDSPRREELISLLCDFPDLFDVNGRPLGVAWNVHHTIIGQHAFGRSNSFRRMSANCPMPYRGPKQQRRCTMTSITGMSNTRTGNWFGSGFLYASKATVKSSFVSMLVHTVFYAVCPPLHTWLNQSIHAKIAGIILRNRRTCHDSSLTSHPVLLIS